MKREKYFDIMLETSTLVNQEISKVINKSFIGQSSRFKEDVLQFVGERMKNNAPLLKPLLLRLSYEVSGGDNWREILSACVAVELLNISSYQANAAFDSKNGKITKIQHDRSFIASMFTRELANELLLKYGMQYNSASSLNALALSYRAINIGQYIDINEISYDRLNSFLTDYDSYIELYKQRCMMLSGEFTSQCASLGARLAGASNSITNNLKHFGVVFGIGLQVVNDIGDYIPSVLGRYDTHKIYQDQFSDFRHGKITLPVYYLIQRSDIERRKILEKYLINQKISSVIEIEIFNSLLKSGSFADAIKFVKKYHNRAKVFLHNIPESKSRDLLSIMNSMLRTNKYFWIIRRSLTLEIN